ncbi:MAG: DNA polymerase III subunit delta [Candidatus Promineofilum sp.]|nr:DNA polymerase III subunit delta [Promineifilum sp.]
MFYLFHGQDTYSQREFLAGLLAKEGDADMLSLNTTRLSGKISFNELQSACDAMPFLARVRVVIVEGLLAATPDKVFLDRLVAYLPTLPAATRLFFLEPTDVSPNHRLVQLAEKEKLGRVRHFALPQGSELDRWIRGHVEAGGGRIAPQAVQLLATNVGSDLAALGNEVDKLLLYAGPEGTITAEDVTRLSPYAAEVSIFDLVDALGARQPARVAALFQQKLNEGADPFYLFSMFIRQFRLLLQTRSLLDAGERPAGVTQQLKLHPRVAEKLVAQARGFSQPQLEQIYRRLLQIDVETKTGQADLLTALHLLVAGVAGEE